MFIKQVSVFLENKQGRLAEVTGILAKDKINIKADFIIHGASNADNG